MGCVLPAVWQEWSVGGVTNLDRIPTKYPTTTFENANSNMAAKAHNFGSDKGALGIQKLSSEFLQFFIEEKEINLDFNKVSDRNF